MPSPENHGKKASLLALVALVLAFLTPSPLLASNQGETTAPATASAASQASIPIELDAASALPSTDEPVGGLIIELMLTFALVCVVVLLVIVLVRAVDSPGEPERLHRRVPRGDGVGHGS